MRNRAIDVPCPDLEILRNKRVSQVAKLHAAFPTSNLDGGEWTLRKLITSLAQGWGFHITAGPLGIAQLLWDIIPEDKLDVECDVQYESSVRGSGCDCTAIYEWKVSGVENPPHLNLPAIAGKGRTRYFIENHTDGFTVWFEE